MANTGTPGARGLSRLFGDLKVRPKLMVLHNVFFLLLAVAVYLALVPLVDRQVATAELDGLDPSSYPVPHLAGTAPAQLADVELGSALAAFAYARDARGGRSRPCHDGRDRRSPSPGAPGAAPC